MIRMSDTTLASVGRADSSKNVPVSKAEIAERLRELADEMDEIAVLMDYYGSLAEWAKNRRYVRDAAGLARLWSYEIEDMTNG